MWVSASVLLGAPTISSQRTVAQGSVVEFCLEKKFLSAEIHLFLSAQIRFFCLKLTLVFAKAQHSRPFSAHPPKLLILQSAIPPEQAVDRTFSDKQLGRPTGRRHNRKTTPLLPPPPHPPLSMEPPHGGHCGRRSFFFTFASRGSNEKEGLLQMRFCDTWAQQFIMLCNFCECALMLRHSQLSTFSK